MIVRRELSSKPVGTLGILSALTVRERRMDALVNIMMVSELRLEGD